MARAPLKTPGRTLFREMALSAFGMLLAVALPQILLLMIWKNPLASLPWLFPIANGRHSFFELLIALIPLTILTGIVGIIFMMDFDKKSHLEKFYRTCLCAPVIGLQLLSIAFVLLAVNYKDESLPPTEYDLVCGMIFISVLLLFSADCFMAASRAELKHQLRTPNLPPIRRPQNPGRID
jgi:hypothetical protein